MDDETGVRFHQELARRHVFLEFYENSGEGLQFYLNCAARWMVHAVSVALSILRRGTKFACKFVSPTWGPSRHRQDAGPSGIKDLRSVVRQRDFVSCRSARSCRLRRIVLCLRQNKPGGVLRTGESEQRSCRQNGSEGKSGRSQESSRRERAFRHGR